MNQTQLNRLWVASGGAEMEAQRVGPFVGNDGVSVMIVHRSSTLQTMTIDRWSPVDCNDTYVDTYVRKRDTGASAWGDWQSCKGEECN
jgi:hypothetical protein